MKTMKNSIIALKMLVCVLVCYCASGCTSNRVFVSTSHAAGSPVPVSEIKVPGNIASEDLVAVNLYIKKEKSCQEEKSKVPFGSNQGIYGSD